MNSRQLAVWVSWLVVVAGLVAGWLALIESGRLPGISGGQPIFLTVAGLSAPLLATIVLRRHPAEWTGPLLCASVITAVLAACRTTPLGTMSQVTGVIALVTVLLPAVIAVRHPALQASRGTVRMLLGCWWLSVAIGLTIAVVATVSGSVLAAWWYTPDPGPVTVAASILLTGYSAVVVIAVAGTAVFAVVRYRSMPPGGRPALRPVVLPLTGWAAATAAAAGWTLFTGLFAPTSGMVEPGNTVLIILPAVLVYALAIGIGWVDVMVRRPAPSVLSARTAESGLGRSGETYVEQYLSRALADPTIRVLYPTTPGGTGVAEWIDSGGRVVRSDVASPDRAVTLIRRGSTLIGLIEQDAAAAARPDAVELVATGAGLIMETERLMAAARRDLEQSRLLASRLLTASDDPRAELRAQLLAGPLRELADAATDLAAGESLAEISRRLQDTSAQVRTISHGVFPPALTAGGLRAALPRSATPARRYLAPVEMTAYLVARSDPLAVIAESSDHAALQITSDAQPLATVRDRVTALGGTLRQDDSRWTTTVPIGG